MFHFIYHNHSHSPNWYLASGWTFAKFKRSWISRNLNCYWELFTIVPFGCSPQTLPIPLDRAFNCAFNCGFDCVFDCVLEFWGNCTKIHLARGKKQNILKCNHCVSENVRCRLWIRSELSRVEVQWVLTSLHARDDSA